MRKLEKLPVYLSIIATVIAIFSVAISYLSYRYQTVPCFRGWITNVRLHLVKMTDEELAELLVRAQRIEEAIKADEGDFETLREQWHEIIEKCRGTFDIELVNTGRIATTLTRVLLYGRPVTSKDENGRETVSPHPIPFRIRHREGDFRVLLEPGRHILVKGIELEVDPVRDIPQYELGWYLDLVVYDIHNIRSINMGHASISRDAAWFNW